MPLITVITPTYNRAHLLPRLYDSLCRQTFTDFEWIVVDDGSTDDTQEVLAKLSADCYQKVQSSRFKVQSNSNHKPQTFKKENGGKHTAVNLGIRYAKGELVFIADSDDMLLPDSLKVVATEWMKVNRNDRIGGIAGLDVNALDGKVIGSGLPKSFIDCDAMDIRYKYHVTGDLKEVFRTSVLREFPFPEIKGERFCPEQLVWFRIAQKYNLHYLNRPIYLVEYQSNGISAGITKARMHSPLASMMTYSEMLGYAIPFKEKVKAAINYWRFRCCYRRTENNINIAMPRVSFLWTMLAPFGVLLHLNDKRIVGKKS